MLAAHLLAALLCGLWLAYGEKAAFRILRAVAGWLAAPLRLLLALPLTPDPPARPCAPTPLGPGRRVSSSSTRSPLEVASAPGDRCRLKTACDPEAAPARLGHRPYAHTCVVRPSPHSPDRIARALAPHRSGSRNDEEGLPVIDFCPAHRTATKATPWRKKRENGIARRVDHRMGPRRTGR
ncbi:hypothetical protein SALBM311S_01238 [Streptomyces alboniger]